MIWRAYALNATGGPLILPGGLARVGKPGVAPQLWHEHEGFTKDVWLTGKTSPQDAADSGPFTVRDRATGEVIGRAVDEGADAAVVDRLHGCFHEIRHGLGVHKPPAVYGAISIDPYSHTPEFTGVQQPGLTGQVKEDVIARFRQLGVRVERGEIVFEPVLLGRDEFLPAPAFFQFGPRLSQEPHYLYFGLLSLSLCS